MLRAHLSKDVSAILFASRNVVLADWLFTTPAIILQLLTGLLMVYIAGFNFYSTWIMGSLVLYIIAGICWLPVVWLQIEIKKMAELAYENNTSLPARYDLFMQFWFWLGWPAFISVMIIIGLMIFKP